MGSEQGLIPQAHQEEPQKQPSSGAKLMRQSFERAYAKRMENPTEGLVTKKRFSLTGALKKINYLARKIMHQRSPQLPQSSTNPNER